MSVVHRSVEFPWAGFDYLDSPGSAYVMIKRIVSWHPCGFGKNGTYIETDDKMGIIVKETPDEVAAIINQAVL